MYQYIKYIRSNPEVLLVFNMKRVARHTCDDVPVPEEQETEGQRQLHNLLLQQLDTDVDIDRLVAKKKCFAPASVYKPFGEQAAGVKSLSQFQSLQEGDQELARFRELGLTDAEIQLWRSKDQAESSLKDRGVSVAPEVRIERLKVIEEKISAHAELLSRPQRFSGSRPLSRREMQIEKALFHGNDRSSFLTALYHQDDESQVSQQGATDASLMDGFYKDILTDVNPECLPEPKPDITQANTVFDSNLWRDEQAPVHLDSVSRTQKAEDSAKPVTVSAHQSIGTLSAAHVCDGPLTVSGKIQPLSEEDIMSNRETEEGIRRLPRFRNYQKGEPSNVLCVRNMRSQTSLAQLVSLFSRFQMNDEEPILYRLLTGRLKGQAFITFCDIRRAEAALEMLNGFRLNEKPLVIEFARERT